MPFDNQKLENMVEHGHNDRVLTMLEGVDICKFIDGYNQTLLHLAAKHKNKNLAQYLITRGANINAQNYFGETPIIIALKNNQEEIIELLLESNADIFIADTSGECALEKAYYLYQTSVNVQKKILNKITTESLRNSQFVKNKAFYAIVPLYNFIPLKNFDMTKILIENGSPVDAKDYKTQKTSLHLAVEGMDVENVKLLIKNHADANAIDYKGKRPLDYLTCNDQDRALEILKILINAGTDLIEYKIRISKLETLYTKGSKDIIHILLKHILILVTNIQTRH